MPKHRKRRWVERHPGATHKPVIPALAKSAPVIDLFAYGPDEVVEKHINTPGEIKEYLNRWPVLWVNIDGLADTQLISEIGRMFDLHTLALEDVMHLHQRAKVEEYGDTTFVTARMVQLLDGHLQTEQISFFLGPNFVVTFQERPGKDCIDTVRDRLRRGSGKLRQNGPDLLLYYLLDAVVDAYFPVLEVYGERLEDLEDAATLAPHGKVVTQIHAVKTDLLTIRRALWPHREMINVLVRDENPLIRPETRLFLRDCYDHTIQLIDLVETYRELGADVRDLFLSSVSNRMNEVMKVLTIISTIFLPLTFIVGIYGMNFNTEVSPWNMPELNWYFGYPFAYLLMFVVTLGFATYFYRKGWIGQGWQQTDEQDTDHNGPSGPPTS
jgi:magnesium transporter